MVLSAASDVLGGRKRAMLIGLSALSMAMMAWFTVLCSRRAGRCVFEASSSSSDPVLACF